MAAAATDLLQEVGVPGTATTLSAPGYTIGNTSVTVGATANWPTATGVTFVIDRAEVVNGVEQGIEGTYCEFVGKVSSGTQITDVSKVFGTDQDYSAGALTRVYMPITGERENRIVEWGLAHANQDGSLKSTPVTTALTGTTLPANTVATTSITNASVTPNKLATGIQSATVATAQATSSATYTDLATTTDTVTVTVGANGIALIILTAGISISTANTAALVTFVASGANTIAASDSNALEYQAYANNTEGAYSKVVTLTGLTAGSTTFKMKYRVTSPSATFKDRNITVLPL